MKPIRITRRGLAFGRNFGTPTAKRSSISDSGSSRTPVSTADSPSATDRNRGTTKKIPAWTRNRNRNSDDPVAQLNVAEHRGVDQRAGPTPDPPVLPEEKQSEHHTA